MEINPLVSIIMPVKNAEAFLDECLQSILNQSYSSWELIAVDDHSSDLSYEKLNALSSRDFRLKVVKNDGKGIISALNTASSLSTGTFITRMDADDVMEINKLELMVEALKKEGRKHVVTAKVKYFADEAVGPGYQQYEGWLNGLIDTKTHWKEIFKECVIASPNWMMYRDDYVTIQGFQNVDYPEDYEFVFRLWENNFKVVGLPQVLLGWREHSLRTSRNDHRFSDLWFSKMKIKYFMKSKYDGRPLLIWGAGNRAKDLVREFEKREIKLDWLTANPNKQEKQIGKHRLIPIHNFKEWNKYQHIISFANTNEQHLAKKFLIQNGLMELEDYFFFA